jgi:hypothetical protein
LELDKFLTDQDIKMCLEIKIKARATTPFFVSFLCFLSTGTVGILKQMLYKLFSKAIGRKIKELDKKQKVNNSSLSQVKLSIYILGVLTSISRGCP